MNLKQMKFMLGNLQCNPALKKWLPCAISLLMFRKIFCTEIITTPILYIRQNEGPELKKFLWA